MEAIGTISIRRHDCDNGSRGLATPLVDSLLCLRVKGGSPLKAGEACRKLLSPSKPSTAVALTVEHLKIIGPAHLAICMEVYRTCLESQREIFICGVDKSFHRDLKLRGVTERGSKPATYPSLVALIAKLTTPPKPGQADSAALAD